MESKIIITPEIIEKANDYVPLLEKQRLAEEIAQKCVVKAKMSFIPTGGSKPEPLPDRCQELRSLTSVYLMGILANKYLLMPYDGNDSLQMPANVYDQWAGSHVMNQLERLKSDKSVNEKVYNLLYDYKELRWLISHEIETVLGHSNDVVWRLMDAMGGIIAQGMMDLLQKEPDGGAEAATDEERLKKAENARREIDEALVKLSVLKDGVEQKQRELAEQHTEVQANA